VPVQEIVCLDDAAEEVFKGLFPGQWDLVNQYLYNDSVGSDQSENDVDDDEGNGNDTVEDKDVASLRKDLEGLKTALGGDNDDWETCYNIDDAT